ncbi:ribonuclease R [bacterium]|nr:ribonuclease R [bacterium]
MKPRKPKDGFGKDRPFKDKGFGEKRGGFGGGRKFGDKPSRSGGGRGFRDDRFKPASVPEVFIVEITSIDDQGDIIGQPVQPVAVEHVLLIARPGHSIDATLGDHVLVKLERLEEGQAVATMMRILPRHRSGSMVGVLEKDADGWQFRPSGREDYDMYPVAKPYDADWEHGQMVRVTTGGAARERWSRYNAPEVKVVEILAADASRVSLLSVHGHHIPMEFSPETLKECKKLKDPVPSPNRTDLRELPLVTIDGEDARDFDDAVYAERLDNESGRAWRLMVAIADVAHYVRHGTALDDDAFERGNSVYFPDRVVPMLPERLSNDLCSLRPDEDRYCMAMEMWLDKTGALVDYRLHRAIMRSHARLTYNQVQAAIDGKPDKQTKPLLKTVIEPLYEVYHLLAKQRDERGALEIDSIEYKVDISDTGEVAAIYPRPRFESHKLIEEFMILANVAAARLVQRVRMPGLYRNHETPSKEKSFELRDYVKTLGLDIHIGPNISAKNFNALLHKVRGEPIAPMVNQAVLRSQMQAFYGPERVGHFGLALKDYAHFTSPIRRYSDLIIHRALIAGLHLGDEGLSAAETKRMASIGEHISLTERRAMTAEREAKERYAIMYLANQVGEEMEGMVSGFSRSGMFVTLKDTGVDGYIPLASLNTDFFVINERSKTARGRNTGKTISLGDKMRVRLEEANSIQKRLRLTWLDGTREDGGSTGKREFRGREDRGGRGAPRGDRPSFRDKPREGGFKRREDGERPAFKKPWEERPARQDDVLPEKRDAKPWDKKDKPFKSRDNFKSRGEGDFKPRRRDEDERPARAYKPREEGGFKPRGERGNEGGEFRPRKRFEDDRPARDDKGYRPRRDYGDERPVRREDGDRPRRSWQDKPPRQDDVSPEKRDAKPWDKKDKPFKSRDNFKPRGEGDFKPRRRDEDERPARAFKPREEGGFKPRRERGDEGGEFRPRKRFDGDRPAGDDRGYRPRREDGERPRRPEGDERPARRKWTEKPREEGSFTPRRERSDEGGEFRPRKRFDGDRPARDGDRPPRRRDDAPREEARPRKPRGEFNDSGKKPFKGKSRDGGGAGAPSAKRGGGRPKKR